MSHPQPRAVPLALSLIEALAPSFSEGVRRNGSEYSRLGLVKVVRASPEEVVATVVAGRPFTVRLWLGSQQLASACSCPDSQITRCAHVWAVFLYAQAHGHLGLPPPDPDVPPPDDDDPEDLVRDLRRALQEWSPRRPARRDTLKERLSRLNGTNGGTAARAWAWPAGQEIVYIADASSSSGDEDGLRIEIAQRRPKRGGGWTKLRGYPVSAGSLSEAPDPADRHILAMLLGACRDGRYDYYRDHGLTAFLVESPLDQVVVPLLCETGRCRLRTDEGEEEPPTLSWDHGGAWGFRIEARPGRGGWVVEGALRRGDERRGLGAPALVVASGLVFFPDQAAPLDCGGAFDWLQELRRSGPLEVPRAKGADLLRALVSRPQAPHLDLSPDLRIDEARPTPRPRLKVRPSERGEGRLTCEPGFDYDGAIVGLDTRGWAVLEEEKGRLVRRDLEAEAAALRRLEEAGIRRLYPRNAVPAFQTTPSHLPRVVRSLVADGWRVEADGKLYRTPGSVRISVVSGIDWFDLQAEVDFEGQSVPFPRLLAALKRGEKTILLGDGTFGMLPEEWLARFAPLAAFGEAEGDRVRFRPSQAALLDALLAAQPAAAVDETFDRARASLLRFDGVAPADPPPSFRGELRDYQREGLGWLRFLDQFGFGGCLADDMGLGKTVQVLGLLESRRAQNESGSAGQASSAGGRPSLVVVPRSLVFNWQKEAERFAPRLRVLDHTGPERAQDVGAFEAYDVVLTTYGTLRRDILLLKDARFDYVVLDEAQAIKNAHTDSAKAARLLQADHRLALSGTPVENHIGELWSLFEFLNPGMLGRASALDPGGNGLDGESRRVLARALRPFVLRRTKEQVAKDLPAKTEQTIYCEMDAAQRRLCDELRDHYRLSLLRRVEKEGLEKSKIQVLEALLRLRQAACHPGLLDPARVGEPSAKLDVLLPRLQEVVAEGHKALVFSQFTSFLAIVRQRIEEAGLAHAYLDGQTRDREERVRRFQEDPGCGVFLISIKAGGLGLNLTAAQYVFLLDPWWNPAVEAQAVDRTHRIGQTRQVFAYRLVVRDSIEEKVLALQDSKRALADAIIGADNGLIRNLGREDLELLLS